MTIAEKYIWQDLRNAILESEKLNLVTKPTYPSVHRSKGRGSPLLIYLSLSYLFIYVGSADSLY